MALRGRSFTFGKAIIREPGASVASGLRACGKTDPDPIVFLNELKDYITALKSTGVDITLLPPLEDFPDSVFVEDTAICASGAAILLRPGAPTRRGEAEAMRPTLEATFERVVELSDKGFVDGGDVLLTDEEAFIGLSARTDRSGVEALSGVLSDLGYRPRPVETPGDILHFKTDCGLLDSETIFATRRLAATGCFEGYRVILAPEGEEAAANLIRVNKVVLVSAGFPRTEKLLRNEGYTVLAVPTSQAALVDGGLSCMSLRL